MSTTSSLPAVPLPPGIRSRFVEDINGLRMHVLEAGFETRGRPCLLLLHGFPELAFSWRKVMPALAAAGYHVIAPDQRGYGRTTGWDGSYDGDLAFVPAAQPGARRARPGLGVRISQRRGRGRTRFRQLGRRVVRAGAARRVSIGGADERAVWRAAAAARSTRRTRPPGSKPEDPVHLELAALPRPRKHYQWYYSTRAKPTRTCTTRRKACMISCAPIIITRVRTGKTTSHIR